MNFYQRTLQSIVICTYVLLLSNTHAYQFKCPIEPSASGFDVEHILNNIFNFDGLVPYEIGANYVFHSLHFDAHPRQKANQIRIGNFQCIYKDKLSGRRLYVNFNIKDSKYVHSCKFVNTNKSWSTCIANNIEACELECQLSDLTDYTPDPALTVRESNMLKDDLQTWLKDNTQTKYSISTAYAKQFNDVKGKINKARNLVNAMNSRELTQAEIKFLNVVSAWISFYINSEPQPLSETLDMNNLLNVEDYAVRHKIKSSKNKMIHEMIEITFGRDWLKELVNDYKRIKDIQEKLASLRMKENIDQQSLIRRKASTTSRQTNQTKPVLSPTASVANNSNRIFPKQCNSNISAINGTKRSTHAKNNQMEIATTPKSNTNISAIGGAIRLTHTNNNQMEIAITPKIANAFPITKGVKRKITTYPIPSNVLSNTAIAPPGYDGVIDEQPPKKAKTL